MNVTLTKLVGAPDPQNWTQVHDFTPPDPEKLAQKGRLIAVISLQAIGEGSVTPDTGREALTRLHEEYFGAAEKSAFTALGTAATHLAAEFKNGVKLQLSAAVILDKVIYLVASGGARASIFRRASLAHLLVSQDQAVTASGFSQEGDALLLATRSFWDALDEPSVKNILASQNPSANLEAASPQILKSSEQGKIAVTLIHFGSSPKPIFSGKIFVKNPEINLFGQDKRRKVSAFVGLILLVLLVISVAFGIHQKSLKDKKGKYASEVSQIQHNLLEAESLASLNPGRARELVRQSQALLADLKSQSLKDPEIDELGRQLSDKLGALAGIYEVDPELFLDLSLLTSGMKGTDLSFSDGTLLVLDQNSKKLVTAELTTKKAKVIAGPDVLGQPLQAAAYAGRNFTLDTKGIYEVEDDAISLMAQKDWEEEGPFTVYTGNAYLLEKATSKIWRLSGTPNAFAAKQDWFGPGVTPNLGSAISMTIDGSIWVLLEGGQVLRFTFGRPDPFVLSGVEGNLESARAIYSFEGFKYLYLLDPVSRRIIVVDRDGAYKAEYLSDKFKETTDFVVSEENKKIVVLTGQTLFSFDLRHL